MFTAFKTIVSVLAVLGAALLGMSRIGWPFSTTFWVDKQPLLAIAILCVGVSSLAELIDRGFAAKRAKRDRRRNALTREAEQILKGALVAIAKLTDLDWTTIGLHLFLVEKRRRLRSRPIFYEIQKHAVRVKMMAYPPPTGFTWTKGKGVIGQCWERKAFVPVDLRAIYEEIWDTSREEWERLDPAKRFGLSYDEFCKDREHAGTILAAPVLGDMGSVYLGCVSLDAPGDCFTALNTDGVKERLQAAADYIAPHLSDG